MVTICYFCIKRTDIFLVLLFVCFISVHVSAQKTHINTNSASDVIQITGEMCDEFRKLWNKNDPKSLEIANTFINFRNRNLTYIVSLKNKTLISCYFFDFEGLLKDVSDGFDYHHNISSKKIDRKDVGLPENMRLNCDNIDVFKKVSQQKEKISSALLESELKPDEKEFLVLYLKSIFEESKIDPDEMNLKCESFLSKFPNSAYSLYVNQILNLEYKTSNWGFGSGFFLGYHFLVGNISNYINPPMSIGAYIDVAYKRFIIKPDITFSPYRSNKKEFNYKDKLYDTDSSSSLVSGNFNFGYSVLDNSTFMITPYIGIGKQAFWIGKGEASIDYNINLNIGTEFEWKFSHFKDKSQSYSSNFYNHENKTYWALILRLGYSNLHFSDPVFGGSMFYTKIGFGFSGNEAKRVHK